MTEQQAVELFLENAENNPYTALHLAVKCLAVSGYCISAGFVRKSPYDHISPPKPKAAPLDA